jgi:hypothetical protein
MAGIGEEAEARLPGQEMRVRILPSLLGHRIGASRYARNVRFSNLRRSSWRWSIPRLDLHNLQPD